MITNWLSTKTLIATTLLLFILVLEGCGSKQNTEYIVRNVYITPELPILDTIERPMLFQFDIEISESGEASLSVYDLQKLHFNERNLIEALRFYERQIEIYREFRSQTIK
jgi:hypothetical protein